MHYFHQRADHRVILYAVDSSAGVYLNAADLIFCIRYGSRLCTHTVLQAL